MNHDHPAATKRITSYDLARHLGVSQSVVSRCFRPNTRVSPEMRDRVLKAAAELGYAPNAIARSLITRRSGMLGLVLTEQTGINVPELMITLARDFAARDLRIVPFVLDDESDRREIFRDVLGSQIEGVVSATTLSDREVELFEARRIPVVYYNRQVQGGCATAVTCDQGTAMTQLVRHLLARGYRSAAFFGGPRDSPVMRDRRDTALAALEGAGLTPKADVHGGFNVASGRAHMNALAAAGPLPELVICANDALAIGAMDAARSDCRLNVPGNVAISGFDGLSSAAWASYDLTTMRQPVPEMLDAVVNLMIRSLADPSRMPKPIEFQAKLVSGSST